MTKTMMNKLRDILFWKFTDSWENNIPVYLKVYFENYDFNIVNIVLSLVGWSKNDLEVQQSEKFQGVQM